MWPFIRRRPQPLTRRRCLETWRPGDVAECVIDSWLGGPAGRPTVGVRAIVLRVNVFGSAVALKLAGFPDQWDATAFRKIVAPPAEDAQDVVEVFDDLLMLPRAGPATRVVAGALLVISAPLLLLATAGVGAFVLGETALERLRFLSDSS